VLLYPIITVLALFIFCIFRVNMRMQVLELAMYIISTEIHIQYIKFF